MSENQKDILIASEFRFRKQFGQNFLSDTNLLDAIAADGEVSGGDTVVEIGTGAGSLTKALAKRAKKVVSFEIDRSLMPVLEQTLKGIDNIEVVFRDFLKTPIEEVERLADGAYRVVANLPYYITTPVLTRFVEEAQNVQSLTLTVQKEVADRLTAKAGTKEYGAITVAVDFFGQAKVTRQISRKMFFPAPNVDSAVVHIEKRQQPFDCSRADFRKVVKSAFAMRRKTLVNNLCAAFGQSRQTYASVLEQMGFDANVRGEMLSTEDFCKLTQALNAAGVSV